MSDRRDPQAWTTDVEDRLGQACCLTLVRSRRVGPTLACLAADTSRSTVASLPELVGSAYGDLREGEWQLAGAAQLPGWTLVLEPNGFACTSRRRIRRASSATTVVTLYRGGRDANELTLTTSGRRVLSLDVEDRAGTVLVERFTGVHLDVELLARLSYRTAWFRLG